MKRDCLIVGGSGFIGHHLVNLLLELGQYRKIVIFDIKPPIEVQVGVEYLYCDIRNKIDIDISSYDFEVVYHLAALAKEPGFEWNEYFRVNSFGTTNLKNFVSRKEISKVIYTSTMMVFSAGEHVATEESVCDPDTAYGSSKLLGEKEWEIWAAETNNELKIVRLGVVFGKHENGNYTRLYKALRKNMFVYVGRKNTVKGSVYVKDVARFLVFLNSEQSTSQLYHLAYPEELYISSIVRVMLDVFGMRRVIPVLPLKVALFAAYLFEMLDAAGIKNPIHHRRIEKLYYSTNLGAKRAFDQGFELEFSLSEAITDWKAECNKGLY